MIKLRPCPFYGQEPKLQTDFRFPRPERERTKAYEVVCQNSDCIIGRVSTVRAGDHRAVEQEDRQWLGLWRS